MNADFINRMFWEQANNMGMGKDKENPYGCGIYFRGNGEITTGYLWYYVYEDYFVLSQCDFTFLSDLRLEISLPYHYIVLRLDLAKFLPSGKIISFLEESDGKSSTVLHKGTRVAYTEVQYYPSYYQKYLPSFSSRLSHVPVDILKSMDGKSNWPTEMMDILKDIRSCRAKGTAAELFFIGKGHELMSCLLHMGDSRIPHNEEDYINILEVVTYINEHYKENIRQKTLVKISNMSATKLKNVFKRFTGNTVTDYIVGKRMDEAILLLTETEHNIGEIARELGFETPTGFATSFKKQTGTSPTAYRRRMAANCLQNPATIPNLSFD